MTKAQRMILDAARRDALRAAGEMASALDALMRDGWLALSEHPALSDPELAGAALTRLLKARQAYRRAMVTLHEAQP
jgi:hypothetical protein